jgi:hypothetical protein
MLRSSVVFGVAIGTHFVWLADKVTLPPHIGFMRR